MLYEELKAILAMHMEPCPCYKNGRCMIGLKPSRGCKRTVPKNIVIAHMVEDPSDPKQRQKAEKILNRLREMGYIEICPGRRHRGTYVAEGVVAGALLSMSNPLMAMLSIITVPLAALGGAMIDKGYEVCGRNGYLETKDPNEVVERVLFLK